MVKSAVEAFLKQLPEDVQKTPWAALAQSLATSIDHDKTSATAKALITPRLVEVLDRLQSLAPGEEAEDELAKLRKRVAGSAAA